MREYISALYSLLNIMRVLIFANKMPDLCGAFLHDIDLAIEFVKRGHQVTFLTIKIPKEGFNGGTYRGFRFLHYTAATTFLDSSSIWVCPHSPILPEVRRINNRGYNRPIVATCHFDGNYTSITGNSGTKWVEMLLFINSVMGPNYRSRISPWPSQIIQTAVIRPIMHEEKIRITEPFQGEYITLVNANENKGVYQFLELAKRMPDRKFLGILPYYGNIRIPTNHPQNIKWLPFDDDIRNVLKQTRILLVPSYYESFGRIAVEAMINGIPVLYSKPNPNSVYSGGSTEGLQAWIGDAAIACNREIPEEWIQAIQSLDNTETYDELSQKSKSHIQSMNLFTEASRIAELIETFSKQNPVTVLNSSSIIPQMKQDAPQEVLPIRASANAQVGFVGGRLRIRR